MIVSDKMLKENLKYYSYFLINKNCLIEKTFILNKKIIFSLKKEKTQKNNSFNITNIIL